MRKVYSLWAYLLEEMKELRLVVFLLESFGGDGHIAVTCCLSCD